MPYIEANGVSLHYALAGAAGHTVVLMHELGGTLQSWDAVAPRLAQRFRVLRYDQRGAGASEKVRHDFSNDTLVEDFEVLAKMLGLDPPYHFVTVAAAATQTLRFLEKHPDQVGALVLCNPAPGVD
ncbi:MAG: alpha/beta fold hydrolase, partial [Xanthobacteraceae bacterium]